jgi:hypothetical protein
MASIYKTEGGTWRVQVAKRGIRLSGTSTTKKAAEMWARMTRRLMLRATVMWWTWNRRSSKMRKSQAEINEWIRQQQARLGIDTTAIPVVKPQPTVIVCPSPYVIERLAHFGADRLIADNPAYEAQCARLDFELASMLEGAALNAAPLPRAKSTRDSLRADLDGTRWYLRTIERGAMCLSPFGCFRVIPFRRAMGA